MNEDCPKLREFANAYTLAQTGHVTIDGPDVSDSQTNHLPSSLNFLLSHSPPKRFSPTANNSCSFLWEKTAALSTTKAKIPPPPKKMPQEKNLLEQAK